MALGAWSNGQDDGLAMQRRLLSEAAPLASRDDGLRSDARDVRVPCRTVP